MGERARLSEREQIAAIRGTRGAAAVSPRLSASWRRSASYGVSLDTVNPVFVGDVDEDSLFYSCGMDVLDELRSTLANEPISMMLTDADGLVLRRVCADDKLQHALDQVYLAPGFGYSERDAGTTGLGLALADRAPTLVRADEHYCTGLWGYSCAAVPVLDPATGQVAGSVNLTTWAQRSDRLLLAVAQLAAGNTTALMLAHGHGRAALPAPRGEVFRVCYADAGQDVAGHSGGWHAALAAVQAALAEHRVVGVVGEAGVGKTALLAAAHAAVRPHDRVLTARPPRPADAQSWLDLWTPELGKGNTSVIAGRVDALPSWAAAELVRIFEGTGRTRRFAVTAQDPAAIPTPLRALVEEFVELPALRHRADDIAPLARYFGHQARGREVRFTTAALRALSTYHWPGNVAQLRQVVRDSVGRGDVVDAHHLAAEVFSGTHRRLTRIETVERDEIVRCLGEPGMTVSGAASRLGISRATIYRRIARYGIQMQVGDRG